MLIHDMIYNLHVLYTLGLLPGSYVHEQYMWITWYFILVHQIWYWYTQSNYHVEYFLTHCFLIDFVKFFIQMLFLHKYIWCIFS